MIPPKIQGLDGRSEPTPFDLIPPRHSGNEILKSRNPLLGYQDGIQQAIPPMLNDLTAQPSHRQMIMCRNELRVKVLRNPKTLGKNFAYNSLQGVSRNESSIFPKPKNNHNLLIPADNLVIHKKSKLGLPK